MTLEIYATRNKKSGQYGKPDFNVMNEKQAKENYTIAALEADEKSKILLAELDLYHLGSYDTETGAIVSIEPVHLLDLGAVKYGGKEN